MAPTTARRTSQPAQHFQDELAKLETQALGGLDMVSQALDRALEAVAHRDIELASMVIADDDRIDGRYLEVHQGILSLLALQAPVAGDLRLVAALLHVIKHVERMGDQCVNIAKLVPLAGHEPPDDDELLGNIARMGELARSLVVQCKQAFERRDVGAGPGPGPPGRARSTASTVLLQPRAGHRRRPRHARVGDAHDARGPRDRADRRQRRGHRRADRVRGHRPVPRVRGRLAPRAVADAPAGLTWPTVPHPNQEAFFPLFALAGHNAEAATTLLDRLMREWPDASVSRGQIKQLEEEGDRITHDILHQLHSTTVTPFDREDIHALAAALDDVVDLTEEAADVLGLYKIEAPMEQALELTGVLRDAGAGVAAALRAWTRCPHGPPPDRVDRLEDEGDRISRQALVALFAGGIDPMVVIRWKDVFERLEQAIDACERVAHLLEGIVVKQAG